MSKSLTFFTMIVAFVYYCCQLFKQLCILIMQKLLFSLTQLFELKETEHGKLKFCLHMFARCFMTKDSYDKMIFSNPFLRYCDPFSFKLTKKNKGANNILFFMEDVETMNKYTDALIVENVTINKNDIKPCSITKIRDSFVKIAIVDSCVLILLENRFGDVIDCIKVYLNKSCDIDNLIISLSEFLEYVSDNNIFIVNKNDFGYAISFTDIIINFFSNKLFFVSSYSGEIGGFTEDIFFISSYGMNGRQCLGIYNHNIAFWGSFRRDLLAEVFTLRKKPAGVSNKKWKYYKSDLKMTYPYNIKGVSILPESKSFSMLDSTDRPNKKLIDSLNISDDLTLEVDKILDFDYEIEYTKKVNQTEREVVKREIEVEVENIENKYKMSSETDLYSDEAEKFYQVIFHNENVLNERDSGIFEEVFSCEGIMAPSEFVNSKYRYFYRRVFCCLIKEFPKYIENGCCYPIIKEIKDKDFDDSGLTQALLVLSRQTSLDLLFIKYDKIEYAPKSYHPHYIFKEGHNKELIIKFLKDILFLAEDTGRKQSHFEKNTIRTRKINKITKNEIVMKTVSKDIMVKNSYFKLQNIDAINSMKIPFCKNRNQKSEKKSVILNKIKLMQRSRIKSKMILDNMKNQGVLINELVRHYIFNKQQSKTIIINRLKQGGCQSIVKTMSNISINSKNNFYNTLNLKSMFYINNPELSNKIIKVCNHMFNNEKFKKMMAEQKLPILLINKIINLINEGYGLKKKMLFRHINSYIELFFKKRMNTKKDFKYNRAKQTNYDETYISDMSD